MGKSLNKIGHWFICVLFLVTALVLHSQNYAKDFVLDDEHSIRNNSYVRSLTYIPQYFVDPATLTSLKDNTDYRPVLQITYALDYWMSGYAMWSWHFTQVLLHVSVAISLYFFTLRLLGTQWASGFIQDQRRAAFWVGLMFLIHPYTAGVVNYISARSSLVVAAFLLPCFTFLLKALAEPTGSLKRRKKFWVLSCVLYGLALFSKVEAIGSFGVLVILVGLDYWRPGDSVFGCAKRTMNGRVFSLLAPYLVTSVIYFMIRNALLDDDIAKARQWSDMTSLQYLFTQITAWWHYVLRWFAPIHLVADDLTYPIFKELSEPRVLFALAGWITVGSFGVAYFGRLPLFWMATLSALALISPTSSIAPLTEMVNEHRPYLPLAILSIGIVPYFVRVVENAEFKYLRSLIGTVLVVSLFLLTWERNRAYATPEAYYEDIAKKAPSCRSFMNYGLIFLSRGDYPKALEYFNRALPDAPYWHSLQINLGLAYEGLHKLDEAKSHLDQAVAYDPSSGSALVFRARFFNRTKQYALAKADLEASLPVSREKYEIYQQLGKASAGLGDWVLALNHTEASLKLDPKRVEYDITDTSGPFWDDPSRYAAGIQYYQGLRKLIGSRPWLEANIAGLTDKLKAISNTQVTAGQKAETQGGRK